MKRWLRIALLLICFSGFSTGCANLPFLSAKSVEADKKVKVVTAEDVLKKAKDAFNEVTYLEFEKDMLIGGASDEHILYHAFLKDSSYTVYEQLTYYSEDEVSFKIENYYDSHDAILDTYTRYLKEDQEPEEWYYALINNPEEINETILNYQECMDAISPTLFDNYAIEALSLTEEDLNGEDCYLLTYDSKNVSNATKDEIIVMYLDKKNYFPVLVTANETVNGIAYDNTYKLSNLNSKQTLEIPAEAKQACIR
ncbi:MAG: hypothetical protein RR364_09135 [Lachnospiraceae bacterium]